MGTVKLQDAARKMWMSVMWLTGAPLSLIGSRRNWECWIPLLAFLAACYVWDEQGNRLVRWLGAYTTALTVIMGVLLVLANRASTRRFIINPDDTAKSLPKSPDEMSLPSSYTKHLIELTGLLILELQALEAMERNATSCLAARAVNDLQSLTTGQIQWWSLVVAHNVLFVLIMAIVRLDDRAQAASSGSLRFLVLAVRGAFALVLICHLIAQNIATVLVVHGESAMSLRSILPEAIQNIIPK